MLKKQLDFYHSSVYAIKAACPEGRKKATLFLLNNVVTTPRTKKGR